MYFYLEPLRQLDDFLPLGDEILEAYDDGEPVGLATVVNSPSRPELLGAKLLLRADGTVSGTLGSAELDEPALETAHRIAQIGNTESVSTEDGTEIFVEGFTTPPTLVMVGGGHVGKATADLANILGYRVYLVDDRPEFCNEERFPYAEETVVTPYDQWSDHLSINVNSYVVVATRGHRYDDMALESALKTRARYIGLLGSRRKTLMIYRRLMEQGITKDRIKEVYAPVGLNIGALTPEEIAVSIMSEIIMVRRGGDGGQHDHGRLVHRPRRQHRRAHGRGLAARHARRVGHPDGRRRVQPHGPAEGPVALARQSPSGAPGGCPAGRGSGAGRGGARPPRR